jgi:hypothetical protein
MKKCERGYEANHALHCSAQASIKKSDKGKTRVAALPLQSLTWKQVQAWLWTKVQAWLWTKVQVWLWTKCRRGYGLSAGMAMDQGWHCSAQASAEKREAKQDALCGIHCCTLHKNECSGCSKTNQGEQRCSALMGWPTPYMCIVYD